MCTVKIDDMAAGQGRGAITVDGVRRVRRELLQAMDKPRAVTEVDKEDINSSSKAAVKVAEPRNKATKAVTAAAEEHVEKEDHEDDAGSEGGEADSEEDDMEALLKQAFDELRGKVRSDPLP